MADNQKMYAVLCGAIDEVIPFWNAFHRRPAVPASAGGCSENRYTGIKTRPVLLRHRAGCIFQRFDQTRREPAGILSSSITRFSLSPRSAESSIPQDSCPIILRGGRFVTATSVLPSSSSGL